MRWKNEPHRSARMPFEHRKNNLSLDVKDDSAVYLATGGGFVFLKQIGF